MNNILSMLLDVEINWVFYTVISVMVILGFLAIFFISRRRNSIGTRALVFGAVTVAITVVLNFLKIDTGLYGGSITFFRLLPLVIYSYMFGPSCGMLAGLCYGLLDSMFDPSVVHPVQYLLDYALPFCFIGLAGFARNFKKAPLVIGTLFAMAGRIIPAFIAGATFWASYMPSDFPVQNAWIYSFVYQCITTIPDMLIVLICAVILTFSKQAMGYFNKIKDQEDSKNQNVEKTNAA